MSQPTVDDLLPWHEPEDLMRALLDAGEGQLPELREAVVRLLDHEDEYVREEAVRRLFVHWRDLETRHLVLDMLAHDPDESVRSASAFGVASTSTRDSLIGDTRALLKIFGDEAQPLELRRSAYEALLLIYDRRDFPPVKGELDLAKDVDWDWIRSLQVTSNS
jgi:HEAT repeat protein